MALITLFGTPKSAGSSEIQLDVVIILGKVWGLHAFLGLVLGP